MLTFNKWFVSQGDTLHMLSEGLAHTKTLTFKVNLHYCVGINTEGPCI